VKEDLRDYTHSMNATELKSEAASYRLKLRNKPAELVACGSNGPVDMDLIDVLVNAISSLEADRRHRSDDAIGTTPQPCFEIRKPDETGICPDFGSSVALG
jgi:hypothetical protein